MSKDIEVKKNYLPDNIKDLARFVLIGREQLVAVRANIRAMDNVGLAADVREQKKGEAQMMAEALLDAEVRLGELFKKMDKAQGARKELGSTAGTKSEALAELGFDKKDAHRFETLADNAGRYKKATRIAAGNTRSMWQDNRQSSKSYSKCNGMSNE